MFDPNKPFTLDRVVRLVLGVIICVALIWLLNLLSPALFPLAVALVLAYMLNPLVERTQRLVRNRALAVVLTLFLVVACGVLAFTMVAPTVAKEAKEATRIMQEMMGDSEWVKKATDHLPPDLWQALRVVLIRLELDKYLTTSNLAAMTQTAMEKLFPGVWGVIAGTANLFMSLLGFFVVGVYLVFLLIDYQKLRHTWQGLIPPAYRDAVVEFVHDFEMAMRRYFRGQASISAIMGVLLALGFWLIGLPMAIVLGLLMGALNMVPYMQILGAVPAYLLAVVAALEGGTSVPVMLGLVTLVIGVVQALQDLVLNPRILGGVMHLSPVVIILSLSIWGQLLGLFGLVIALPLTFLVLTYYRRLLRHLEWQKEAEEQNNKLESGRIIT